MLTEKEVEHIADLARIKLDQAEKANITRDLGSILNYIDKLKEVNTDGVEPTAQVTGLENIFREDKTEAVAGAETEKLLGQFPHKKDGYLKVKPVFESR